MPQGSHLSPPEHAEDGCARRCLDAHEPAHTLQQQREISLRGGLYGDVGASSWSSRLRSSSSPPDSLKPPTSSSATTPSARMKTVVGSPTTPYTRTIRSSARITR